MESGIHLSHSGIKRLQDGINRHIHIVDDFQACVIGSLRRRFSRGNRLGQNTIKQSQRQPPETDNLTNHSRDTGNQTDRARDTDN